MQDVAQGFSPPSAALKGRGTTVQQVYCVVTGTTRAFIIGVPAYTNLS